MSKIFAENLKAYRIMADMTQEDLAKAASITRNSIANYESGRSEPNFEILCIFSRVLGVDLNDLVRKHEVPDFTRRMQVTDEESAVIQAYREADPIYRTVALDILRSHRRGG